jgi:hypothetical protein
MGMRNTNGGETAQDYRRAVAGQNERVTIYDTIQVRGFVQHHKL